MICRKSEQRECDAAMHTLTRHTPFRPLAYLAPIKDLAMGHTMLRSMHRWMRTQGTEKRFGMQGVL
eukprot:5225723-Amphidinium_carterae.1